MIFKVQRTLFSTGGESYLVYNKDKSILRMFFRPFKPPIRAIDIKNEKRETCSVYLIRASGNALQG